MPLATHKNDEYSFSKKPYVLGDDQLNLIEEFLREQQELTAVDRFSQKHASTPGHAQKNYYQDLIPIRKPSTGEQYAFEVDLDKCTGCKACVVACHSLNGLNDQESWRDIGSIRGVVDGVAEQQTVTTACHHCADPACLNGCPVGAYEKEKDTGVVRHLDDQCIGCQYCSLKCPYDVPKYDKSLGIVRKCDMCHERLAEGEAPACVQSCPSGAIQIKVVQTSGVHEAAKGGRRMLPGAFQSEYTKPTTVFRSKRKLDATMQASDEYELTPAHSHLPLVTMLMLTQVAVGLSLVDGIGRLLAPERFTNLHLPLLLAAVLLGKVGLIASFTHLGSPKGAWRCFLGLKTSWLSREVILFGAWMPALMLSLAVAAWPHLYGWAPTAAQEILPSGLPGWFALATSASAVLLGLVSVFCSIMVYVDTRRAFWSMGKTLGRFGGTMLLGGFTGLCAAELIFADSVTVFAVTGVLLSLVLKLVTEIRQLTPAKQDEWSYAKKSALLQLQPLSAVLKLRWLTLTAAMLAVALAILVPPLAVTGAVVACISLLASEWLERKLFFQAVVTLKMPGELSRPH
ncbi:dimethyl sulfoxide reductase anchor subunit [Verrucomicrobiaceae bacterium R5-34]|nr:dimethyl sulfoxide reductase anchor subunit [Verrucomicrobiaceae bacterium R5-34]